MTSTETRGTGNIADTRFSCVVHDGPGIDNALSMTTYGSTTNTYFYLTDHLGTVHALATTNGVIVESYKYDAWGRVLGVYDQNAAPLTESAVGNRILWQGRESSWKTGLYCFRARWYDPVTGRWLSNDPIGISGGLNQYQAFLSNPVNFRDPSGTDIWIGEGSGVGGGPVGALHENINIGDPNGQFVTYSYMTENRWSVLNPFNQAGEVYVDNPARQLDPSRYLNTTPEQDSYANWMITQQLNQPGPYRLWGANCVVWANQMFDFFKEDMEFDQPNPPPKNCDK